MIKIDFGNKKKLKAQNISVTENLTKVRMDRLRQAKETYGYINEILYLDKRRENSL